MILDVNKWGDFLENKTDLKPLRKWVEEKTGKIVYSNYKKISKETDPYLQVYLRDLSQSGKLKLINKDEVEKSITEIKKSQHQLKSNDIHILALAKTSNTKLLCSSDKNLHKDFIKIIKNGKVYQTTNHKHLLKKDLCP